MVKGGRISNAKKLMTHGGEGLEEEMNEGGEERWVGIGGRAVVCCCSFTMYEGTR